MKLKQLITTLVLLGMAINSAHGSSSTYRVDWDGASLGKSSATATVEVITNPLLDPQEESHKAITEKIWGLLEDLNVNYVRYLAWFPYPRYSVAKDATGWKTDKMGPMFERFINATEKKKHSAILNFAAQPAQYFEPVTASNLSDEAYEPVWNYANGELPSANVQPLAEYYKMVWRLAKNGWAVDKETGENVTLCGEHCARSELKYWEVFNDNEHYLSADDYVSLYKLVKQDMVETLGEKNVPKFIVGGGMPSGMLMSVLDKIKGDTDYVSFNYRVSSRERTNPYTYEE